MQLVHKQNVIPMQPQRPSPILRWAGWMMDTAHALGFNTTTSGKVKRQLCVLETLSLGGRKQLLLIRCGDDRFLVGTGADSVQTIVSVKPDAQLHGASTNRDEAGSV